jgi:uncharacterized protein involved in oxidation of intracellular sulfur
MKCLIILNDAPYGTERSYNGLRLAGHLSKVAPGCEVAVFLLGDAVGCARASQKTPTGYYNIERMLKPIVRQGQVLLCGSCMDARGLREEELAEGCRRSTLNELTQLTLDADKVLVF